MTKLLITLHVLAVVLLVGPVAVAVSLFPRYAKRPGSDTTALLHRVSKLYGLVALAVPVLGFGAAAALKVSDNQWVIESSILTLAAALLLGLVIVPAQRKALQPEAPESPLLPAASGVFNLLWVVILVLMVYRPGFHKG
jgi:hypothetical protein